MSEFMTPESIARHMTWPADQTPEQMYRSYLARVRREVAAATRSLIRSVDAYVGRDGHRSSCHRPGCEERKAMLANANAEVRRLTLEVEAANAERDMCESAVAEMMAP